jgi:DnaJ-class molecular chaperone
LLYDNGMSTTNHRDFYEILGINKDANPQEIREAYRKLAFQYHPDRNKDDPKANEKMKAINEAYATLSDPAKRKNYDSFRERFGAMASDQFRQTYSQEDIFRNSDISQIFEEFSKSFGYRNADDVLRQFYGEGFRRYEFRGPGFMYRTYTYSPNGQANGANSIPAATERPGCSGRLMRFLLKRVLKIQMPERGKDIVDKIQINPEIEQTGGEVEYNCQKWKKPRNIMVKIPSGIKNGQTIRLKDMGMAGKGGGPSGDLLLRVKVKKSISERIKKFF